MKRLADQFAGGEVDHVMGGRSGRRRAGSGAGDDLYPREMDPDAVANESNTGSSFRSSRELLQAQVQ